MIRDLPGLFVTGTDTGVGKTRVAAAIAADLTADGHRVAVLKPVATGGVRTPGGWRSEDTDLLIRSVGDGIPPERVTPLNFAAPLAPPVAARSEGITLDHSRIHQATREALAWWAVEGRADVAVIEGVGGILCPLAEGTTIADLAIDVDYPLVIVARRALGTLNHTLLTVEAAQHRGLRIAGVVLNSPEPAEEGLAERTNADELNRRLGGIPILAEIDYNHEGTIVVPPAGVVDWWQRARPPRLV